MNGFPTTNGQVRSSAIYRTFQHYRIKKSIFIQFVLRPETFITRNGIRLTKVATDKIFAIKNRYIDQDLHIFP